MGCHPTTALPPLDLTGLRSMVLLATDARDVRSVEAVRIEDPRAPIAAVSGRPGDEIAVLGFTCPLEWLGLEPGLQVLQTSEPDISFPVPALMLHTWLEDQAWSPLEEVPEPIDAALRSLRPTRANSRCGTANAHYHTEVAAIPDELRNGPSLLLPLGPEAALVGSRDGRLYRVGVDASVQTLRWRSDPVVAGYRAPDGVLWLLTVSGALERGSVESDFTQVVIDVRLASRDQAFLVGPDAPSAPFELFAVTDLGTFARFDGATWTVLTRLWSTSTVVPGPELVWVGPNEALAGSAAGALVHVKDGIVDIEDVPGAYASTGLAIIPGVGLVFGVTPPAMYLQRPGELRTKLSIDHRLRFTSLFAPVGRGFIYGGSTGANFIDFAFGRYQPSLQGCPIDTLTDEVATHLVALSPTELMALTTPGTLGPLNVVLLHQTQPSELCTFAR